MTGSRIQKRPLLRPQQPASSNSNLIYVSSSAPFIALVKRIRKQLDRSLKGRAPSTRGRTLAERVQILETDGGTSGGGNCEVLVLGTGKAIEKTLSVASWFMGQGDCHVNVKTGTVSTVDDIVVEDDTEPFEDESRVRRLSSMEVAISLK